MVSNKNFAIGFVLFSLFLFAMIPSVQAAVSAVFFSFNTTLGFDNDGTIAVNWTSPGADGAANFTIYAIYANNLSVHSAVQNDSITGRKFTGLESNITYFFNISTNGTAVNVSSANITVDTYSPRIAVNSPSNLSFSSIAHVLLNFTLNDSTGNPINWTLWVDGVSNASGTNATNNTALAINITGLTQGTHYWWVQATDNATNQANSTNRTFYVDTTNPTATSNSPANHTNLSTSYATLNFTLTDNIGTPINWTLWIDGVANTSGTNATNDTALTINITGLADGKHYWWVQSIDNASNKANSTNRSFTTDTTKPTLTLTLNKDSAIIGDTITATCTGSDNVFTTFDFVITLIKPLGSEYTSSGFGASHVASFSGAETSASGTNTIKCTATDNSTNSNSTTKTITISVESSNSGGGSGAQNTNNQTSQPSQPTQSDTKPVPKQTEAPVSSGTTDGTNNEPVTEEEGNVVDGNTPNGTGLKIFTLLIALGVIGGAGYLISSKLGFKFRR